MKLGVLSDTHGHIEPAEAAIELLRSEGVDVIIHCGDVGAAVVPLFEGLRTHFVVGNVDDPARLRAMIKLPEHTLHEPPGTLDIDGRKVAFLHGHDARLLGETIRSARWDLVCHGHSHVYSERQQGPTLVLNPGAVWRSNPRCVAVVELPSLRVNQIFF